MCRRGIHLLAALGLVLISTTHAAAHGAEEHVAADGRVVLQQAGPRDWNDLARTWGTEPYVLVGLGLSAVLYAVGLRRTWSAAGVGHGVRRWEAGCYLAGWLALFVALVSPLHPWGGVLFSAHMTQHEILMLLAAPLIALGRPLITFLRALPIGIAGPLARASNGPAWKRAWHTFANPFSAWLIHAVALWAWHIPALFDATLRSELVHAAQHASFLLTALLFWWAVIHGKRAASAYGMAVLYLFTTAVHSGVLGALITLSNRPLYSGYSQTTASWGLTPLQDQQLGGLIMWIPAGLVYIVAGLAFTAGWIRESERRTRVREASMLAVKPAIER